MSAGTAALARLRRRPAFLGLARWELVVMGIYLAILAGTILHHQPWFDEAQAWLLARDASPAELVTVYARYEGSPLLWHFLLLLPAKTHMPYITLNVLSGLIGAAGVLVFLRRAPFPTILRVAFVFSYYAIYQYSVVARSYALLVPLMFLLAMAYPARHRHPLRYVVLLALLANVAVHGTVIAACLALLLGIEVLRGSGEWAPGRRRAAFLWLLLLGAVFIVLAITLRTPPDQSAVSSRLNLDPTHARQILVHVVKATFSEQALISAAVFLLSVYWFYRSGHLVLFLLPFTGVVAIFALRYFSPWHEGIVFLLWLFVMWVSFSERRPPSPHPRARLAALAALAATLAIQVGWAADTLVHVTLRPYSGSQAAAAYIKAHGLDRQVLYGSGFWAIGLQPYFDHNIFANYHDGTAPSFYLWKTSSRFATAPYYLNVFHPDYILYGVKFKHERPLPIYYGYRKVETFPGDIFWKSRTIEEETFVLYQRDDLKPLR